MSSSLFDPHQVNRNYSRKLQAKGQILEAKLCNRPEQIDLTKVQQYVDFALKNNIVPELNPQVDEIAHTYFLETLQHGPITFFSLPFTMAVFDLEERETDWAATIENPQKNLYNIFYVICGPSIYWYEINIKDDVNYLNIFLPKLMTEKNSKPHRMHGTAARGNNEAIFAVLQFHNLHNLNGVIPQNEPVPANVYQLYPCMTINRKHFLNLD